MTADFKIYDTSKTHDIVKLYKQSIQQGAQLVIGPLTKNAVTEVSD